MGSHELPSTAMGAPQRAIGCSLLVLAAALALPKPARANGRFPSAQHVIIGPEATTSTTLVLRTTFGFAVSDDSGRSFHWVCENALGYGTDEFDPSFVLARTGALFVGLFNGVTDASADRCTFSPVPVLADQFVTDMDQNGPTLVAVTSSGAAGARNAVYRSDNDGATWRAAGGGLTDVLFSTLEMAPGHTQRIYLTGVTNAPRLAHVYRSDDGGATLAEQPFPMASVVADAFIAAVDPTNPDVVYLRAPLPTTTEAGVTEPTVLLKSADAGATWREIARTHASMLGFAISDDGRTLWLGGPDPTDGLQRSDDAGDTWQTVGHQDVLCLRQHAGALYLCSSDVVDGFALGRSTDLGATFAPVLAFANLQGPFTCPASSPENNTCGPRWPTIAVMFQPMDAGTHGDGAPTVDSGPATSHAGCSCATTAGREPRRGPAAFRALALVAVGVVRRRSRVHKS